MMKQVCVIPFRRDFLKKYEKLTPTPLEVIESVDMMRILENGLKIKMVYISEDNCSVDTKEDLKKVTLLMKKGDRDIDLLDISQIEHKSPRSNKIKTTDINILLNRVKMTKKTELKKRIIFLALLLSGLILVSIFTFIT